MLESVDSCANLFQCGQNSTRCISRHRVFDGIIDCGDAFDEDYEYTCQLNITSRFQCGSSMPKRCIPRKMLINGEIDCPDGSDEIFPGEYAFFVARDTIDFRGAWLFRITPTMRLLPSQRIAAQLWLDVFKHMSTCSFNCGRHGICRKYLNDIAHPYYCQCDPGWIGEQCEYFRQYRCAIESFSIRSTICVCPLTRFGPTCRVPHDPCETKTNTEFICANNGTCLPDDPRVHGQYICICPLGFQSTRCDKPALGTRITINESMSFAAILVYFVRFYKRLDVPL
ncbi:unnamed protein product, partial [Rotaria sp. Silwood1]